MKTSRRSRALRRRFDLHGSYLARRQRLLVDRHAAFELPRTFVHHLHTIRQAIGVIDACSARGRCRTGRVFEMRDRRRVIQSGWGHVALAIERTALKENVLGCCSTAHARLLEPA